MRKLLLALSLLLVAVPAYAALKSVLQITVGGPTYSGPGDVVSSATAWWGLRSYSAAYAAPGTNPAVDVCDSATGLTCSTIAILASGDFDKVTAAASTACAVACKVTKLYDQTGNGLHVTQATIANAPVLTFNCINTTFPCMTFTGASSQVFLSAAGAVTFAANNTISMVYDRTNTSTSVVFGTSATGSAPWCGGGAGANLLRYTPSNTNNPTVTVSDNAFHAAQCIGSGAASASTVYHDGTNTSNGFQSTGLSAGQIEISSSVLPLTGKVTEVGIWGVTFTTSGGNQASAMNTNQHTYWGF